MNDGPFLILAAGLIYAGLLYIKAELASIDRTLTQLLAELRKRP
jgi:hypothetical protein